MINRFTGQLDFEDGFRLHPFERVDLSETTRVKRFRGDTRREPAIRLGTHTSEFGLLDVSCDLDSEMVPCRVGLSCPSGVTSNPTRWKMVLDDIIQRDLGAEVSFTWGTVEIIEYRRSILPHLVITYRTANNVERPEPPRPRKLSARSLPAPAEGPLSLKPTAKSKSKLTQK
jgi:hypothetical protein